MNQKVIAIYSPKGGVGKTTLTLQLADALVAKRKVSVHIIDRDNQGSVQGFVNLARKEERPIPFNNTNGVPKAAPHEDVILIDHAPRIGQQYVPPKGVDLVIVPVRPSFLDFDSLAQFRQELLDQGFNVLFVLNSYRANTKSHEAIGQNPGVKGWPKIHMRTAFEGVGEGWCVFSKPDSDYKARNDIMLLVDAIEQRIGRISPSTPAAPAATA